MKQPTDLYLNLKREFFERIAARKKREEYRESSDYWRKRFKGFNYKVIYFRNGYAKKAPEMRIECRGLSRRGGEFVLSLGRILDLKGWPIRPKAR